MCSFAELGELRENGRNGRLSVLGLLRPINCDFALLNFPAYEIRIKSLNNQLLEDSQVKEIR